MALSYQIPNAIDFSYVEDIADGQTSFLNNLLEVILKSLDKYPELLLVYAQTNNEEAFRECAHKFKSSVAYLGVVEFTNYLDDLEQLQLNSVTSEEINERLSYLPHFIAFLKKDLTTKLNSF